MGGVIQYKLYGSEENAKAAFSEMSQLFLDLDQEFSANREDSTLSHINAEAGAKAMPISAGMLEIMQLSVKIEQASQGAFNPMIGPLVNLWKIGFSAAHVPTEIDIQNTLPLLNIQDLVLETEPQQISFLKPGMSLDLGSIVKGYAAGLALEICQKYELLGALISVNGNLAVYGQRPEGALWNVGIIDPRGENGAVVGSIALKNVTVATSGDYERYFEVEGVRYHHLLDSKTGYPAATDLISVSIFSEDGALSDALSTATFILGREKGEALLADFKSLDYLLIDKDFKLWSSPMVRDQFKLLSENYQWGIE